MQHTITTITAIAFALAAISVAPIHAGPARTRFTPSCDTAGPNGFVGVTGENVPGGDESDTLGGSGNEACDKNDAVLGGAKNLIGNGGDGPDSSIAGGDGNQIPTAYGFIGGGSTGNASGAYSAIGGGYKNTTGSYGEYAIVGAGMSNYSSGPASMVGAGVGNNPNGNDAMTGAGEGAYAAGNGAMNGGGNYAYVTLDDHPGSVASDSDGVDSFLGAGDNNYDNEEDAFVGSGSGNLTWYSSPYSVVLGGYANANSAEYGALLAGDGNAIGTSSNTVHSYGMTVGGNGASARGTLSCANGYQVQANDAGSFIWGDASSENTLLNDTSANEFIARAAGGFTLYSNAASTSGVKLAAGSGAWASLSDRNAKNDIVPLDDDSILAKVATLPISTWQYKTERGVRHIGPMAQDFYAAFHAGTDARHISAIDEDGVALTAIKALKAKSDRKDRNADEFRDELRAFEARLARRAR